MKVSALLCIWINNVSLSSEHVRRSSASPFIDYNIPSSNALSTALVLSRTPSLAMTEETWFLMVPVDLNMTSAISLPKESKMQTIHGFIVALHVLTGALSLLLFWVPSFTNKGDRPTSNLVVTT